MSLRYSEPLETISVFSYFETSQPIFNISKFFQIIHFITYIIFYPSSIKFLQAPPFEVRDHSPNPPHVRFCYICCSSLSHQVVAAFSPLQVIVLWVEPFELSIPRWAHLYSINYYYFYPLQHALVVLQPHWGFLYFFIQLWRNVTFPPFGTQVAF